MSDSDPKGKPGELAPESSGSIDVSISSTKLPVSDGTPAAVGDLESAPVSSGKVKAAIPTESTSRSKRLTAAAKGAIDHGVEKLGSGIETIGEGVSKLGDISRKVPLVGSSVAKLGDTITQMGESIHDLPRAARTRQGRLLFRSIIVAFALVFGWIAVIVGLQLHGNDTPDFRPDAERILVEISKGPAAIDKLYEASSPRFQEMVRKERFIDDFTDLNHTVGNFLEITAINDTLVTTGPTGRIGRVSLTIAYDKGVCRGAVSFHLDQGRWKLLGIGVELPPDLKIPQEQRNPVRACVDPMAVVGAKACDVHLTADRILKQISDGHADVVWDEATPVFQQQEDKLKFSEIQSEHIDALGKYMRIITVTEATVVGGTTVTFDALAQFEQSEGVRTVFSFFRSSKTSPWKLRSMKVVVPMPRLAEEPAHGTGSGAASTGSGSAVGSGSAGSGSAGSGSGKPRGPR